MPDPCHCDHDFLDHTRAAGVRYTLSETEVACSKCDCEDFIPTPTTRHWESGAPRPL